jgi:hypothetical protein
VWIKWLDLFFIILKSNFTKIFPVAMSFSMHTDWQMDELGECNGHSVGSQIRLKCSLMQYFHRLDVVHLRSRKASFSGMLSLYTSVRSLQFLLMWLLIFLPLSFSIQIFALAQLWRRMSWKLPRCWNMRASKCRHFDSCWFEVLTGVNMKSTIFWVVMPQSGRSPPLF